MGLFLSPQRISVEILIAVNLNLLEESLSCLSSSVVSKYLPLSQS